MEPGKGTLNLTPKRFAGCFFISRWALTWEGDYKMHPVHACVHACMRVCALVCHTDFRFSATDFLSINCPNEFSCS